MPLTNASEKMLGFSLSDYVHSPRAQALPSNSVSYKQRVWSFLQTLSLSPRYSCSNELNHTSDATKNHDHGYELSATELLNLFLSFCPTLLASSQHCLPLPTDQSLYSKRQNSKAILLPPFTSTHYPPNNLSITLQTEALSYTRHCDCSPASFLSSLVSCQNSLFQIALSSPSRFQTAILHKCITIPNHNLEPAIQTPYPFSATVTDPQPSGTSHADVMQRRPSQTQNGSKIRQLVSLISGRSKVRVT
jgi:hypothetical protein